MLCPLDFERCTKNLEFSFHHFAKSGHHRWCENELAKLLVQHPEQLVLIRLNLALILSSHLRDCLSLQILQSFCQAHAQAVANLSPGATAQTLPELTAQHRRPRPRHHRWLFRSGVRLT